MSAKIKITLLKSHIGRPASQRDVLNGLGLSKIRKTVMLEDTSSIRGMINKVQHLVKVEE
jgi:large subunit ribosomal protein L30